MPATPTTAPTMSLSSLPPDTEVLIFIGEHMTENYPEFGVWRRLVYHLFRSAVEQHGIEFADRVKFMLLRGNSNKKPIVNTIFKSATAAIRARAARIHEYEEEVVVADEFEDEDDDI